MLSPLPSLKSSPLNLKPITLSKVIASNPLFFRLKHNEFQGQINKALFPCFFI